MKDSQIKERLAERAKSRETKELDQGRGDLLDRVRELERLVADLQRQIRLSERLPEGLR